MNTYQTLQALADHLPLLTPAPGGTSPADGQPRASGATSRPPIRLSVVDLMGELSRELSSWVQVVFGLDGSETSRVWIDPPTSLAGRARWLLPWCDRLVADEHLGDDWVASVDRWWAQVQPLVGARPDRVPNCPGCGWRLAGRGAGGVPVDQVADWRWAVCTGCGSRYTFDAGLQQLGRVSTLTLWEFAVEQQIPLPSLRRRARGLAPVGALAGRHLYRRTDLDALIASDSNGL